MARLKLWGTSLRALGAEWLEAPEGRYNVGFRFRCPVHVNGQGHWLQVTLENPYDGLLPVRIKDAVRAWRVEGAAIGTLTLETPSGSDELHFSGCGRLRIINGRVGPVR
jgi:hypothetical protein